MRTDLDLKGFEVLERVLNPKRVKESLKKNIKDANQKIGIFLVDAIRRGIRERNYASNAPLTKLLKGSDLPLVDNGDLIGGISYSNDQDWILDVGSNRKKGGGKISIDVILHDGATISVTDKMRGFFRYLAYKTKGSVKPLSPKTSTIVIKPRPFLKNVIYDNRSIEKVQDEWLKAIKKTFEEK